VVAVAGSVKVDVVQTGGCTVMCCSGEGCVQYHSHQQHLCSSPYPILVLTSPLSPFTVVSAPLSADQAVSFSVLCLLRSFVLYSPALNLELRKLLVVRTVHKSPPIPSASPQAVEGAEWIIKYLMNLRDKKYSK
jgi:hypothetical protein